MIQKISAALLAVLLVALVVAWWQTAPPSPKVVARRAATVTSSALVDESVYATAQRLAQLGINEEQIYSLLQAKNVVADGGRVRVGDEHIAVDPTGAFDSAEDMLGLVIGSDSSGRQLMLKDVATIDRSYEDPPRRLLRFDGQPAIGLGISTVQGGNVVTMGNGVRRKLEELKRDQPVGIEIGDINFQPTAVTKATNAFIFNLGKAVAIVFVVLLFAMGRRAGLIIGWSAFPSAHSSSPCACSPTMRSSLLRGFRFESNPARTRST